MRGICISLIFYWVSVISGYHRLSWHQDIVMKYFDTHIFVIIHFAPLFISEWPNIQNFREYEDRHKVIIVNLLKIIGDCWQTKQITARKTNTTRSCYKIKPHYLNQNYNQNDSVILFMWAQQFGENILSRVRARAWLEASDRRVSVTGPSQKHFRLSYQRNCERRRGPEETVPMEPEWH